MRHLFTIILITTTTLFSACATEPVDDDNDDEDSDAIAEPATEVGDIARWQAAEADGAPSGTVFVAESSESSDLVAAAFACPRGFACLYQNANLRGSAVAVQSGIGIRNLRGIRCRGCTNGIHGNDGTFNDQMTSWENLSGRKYCWFFDAGPSGERHVMRNNFVIRQVLARENDRASAFGPCL